jgi:transcriptional regulator with XRE-family HTH domain
MGTNLRKLRTDRGWTHEEAAERMGISRGQFIKLERGERQLTDRTITLAAKAFGVSKGEIVDEVSSEPSRPAVNGTVEDLPAHGAFRLAKIDGSVQAGAFLALEAFDDDLGEVVSAPRDPVFPFARQRAHRVKGDSMNQARPNPMNDGDIIITAAWEDLGLAPKDGLNVVVQQTTADGQLRERSVKELKVFPDRVEFHPRSSNKAHKPIVMRRDHHTDDGKEVTILSLVRFVFNNQALPV